MPGIYCIINTKNGKRYVGQSVDVGRRIREHLSELKSNTHPNKDLQEDFNKFSHYFKISYLELNVPQSKLSAREKYWIDFYRCRDKRFGYNIQVATVSRRYSKKERQAPYHENYLDLLLDKLKK